MKHIITIFLTLLLTIAATGCKEEKYVHVGPNWAGVNDLTPSGNSFAVHVTGNRELNLGDNLTFQATSGKDGKLWVVQVDPEDRVTLLFPNQKSKDNCIAAGTPFQVPPKDAGWRIQAEKPTGKSVVAFIVTTGDTDLQDVLGRQKSMSKALTLVENTPSWGVEKVVIDVND